MTSEAIFVGMDLGTFKTSVTSSNGRRGVVHSAVGRPRDTVARALLGRDVVFGEEIRERRLALNVVRPFERGVLKYNDAEAYGVAADRVAEHQEAARLLVAHAVSLTQPAPNVPVYGVIGAPSRASVANKQVIFEAARESLDAIAIVPEPFAVAYGMNRIVDTLVVDIGAGTIDICPLHGTFPTEESQVTIPLGGDAVDQRLGDLITKKFPQARISETMVRDIKEKYGFVDDPQERVLVTLPTDGRPQAFDVTELIREACQALVVPIVDGVLEVLHKYDPEFQSTLLQNIVLAGGGSQLKGLDRLVEQSLKDYHGGNVRKVYDSMFAGATGALKLAMDMPVSYWEQLRAQMPAAA